MSQDNNAKFYKRNGQSWSLFDNKDLKRSFDENINAAALSSKVEISRSNVNNNSVSNLERFRFWMTSQFTYNINANWQQTIDLASALGGLNKVTSYIGSSTVGTAGISTRQTYSGSGFIDIRLSGRLFHPRMVRSDLVTGTGSSSNLFEQVNYLNKLVIPGNTTSLDQIYNETPNARTSERNQIDGIRGAFSRQGSVFNINSYIFRNPPIFHLSIGNVFDNDAMVCKSLNVTFSKEYCSPVENGSSERQPIYADVELEFSSLYAVTSPTESSGKVDSFVFFVGDAFDSLSSSLTGESLLDVDRNAADAIAQIEPPPPQQPTATPPTADAQARAAEGRYRDQIRAQPGGRR